MRSEGFSFISGGLGVEVCSRVFGAVRNRLIVIPKALQLREAFGGGFGWNLEVSDSCDVA